MLSALRKVWLFEIPLLAKWRPYPLYELVSYLMMFAAPMMLAYGLQPYSPSFFEILVLVELAMFSGFFGAIMCNDYTDKDIDAIAHPDRPIPKGLTSSRWFFVLTVIMALAVFVFSVSISGWCLLIVVVNATFVGVHNLFLKKRVKIPAYSEIFTPLQWLTVMIFGFLAVWSSLSWAGTESITAPLLGTLQFESYDLWTLLLLLVFTYFVDDAHDLPEGIHDVEGDKALGVRTYASSFGVKTAAKVSFGMFVFSGLLGILLYLRTFLSPIFLIGFILMWACILKESWELIHISEEEMKEKGAKMGRRGYDFLLFIFDLIFIDIAIQIVWNFWM